MKGTSLNTQNGSIVIDHEVIAQYAGSVAVECFGIVGMASVNMRDGIVKLLNPDRLTHGISVSVSEKGGLILHFHVIVSYGVGIRTVAENLIDSVKYKVEEFTSLKIEKIKVYVEGVRVID
ncbi:MAG: Asp23/Gls24 family envelope stress response protein [Lachnospiraceae bacterium]|nr:Asp23/Gls24 family envelope stress response protein [Lachnospiraceae bacterium]MCR4704662.1 Asp23/Gls24 family envelope stress response protein [Lachnospiraceae bacterium]